MVKAVEGMEEEEEEVGVSVSPLYSPTVQSACPAPAPLSALSLQ